MFPAAEWTLGEALARKGDSTISVCIPALNEGLTIGHIVDTIRDALTGPDGLVDEIVVLDDRSSDDTARRAADAGARVVPIDSIHASVGAGHGKGNAMWTSLLASSGDIVVWCDGDVTTLEPSWIVRLVVPLLVRPELAFVKARYHRPDDQGGGGRTTELVARPLLSLIEPRLAAIAQPLAGEMAGRRTVLEDIPFVQGWGVELTLLLEIAKRHGVEAIVEVDLGERRHRHHQLEQLALQAAEVLVTGLRWAGLDPSSGMVDLIRAGGEHRQLNLAHAPTDQLDRRIRPAPRRTLSRAPSRRLRCRRDDRGIDGVRHRRPASTSLRRPVTDWAGDWDWLDPAWGADAPEIWQSLRDAGCDVAFTERYGRAWMPIGYDAISEVAYDTEHFSSFRVSVSHPDSPVRPAPPITSDPPEHHEHRRLLLPAFSPKAVDPLTEETRRYCRELIERLDGRDVADAAGDYSQHIPVHLIAHMVGVPESDADVFRDWIFRNFQLGPIDPNAKLQLQAGHGGLLRPAPRRPARRAGRRPGDATSPRPSSTASRSPASCNAGTCR